VESTRTVTPSSKLRIAILAVVLVTVAGVGAAAAAPRVQVSRAGTAVPAGSTDDVGALPVMMQNPVTYTVTNVGDAALQVIDVGVLTPLNGGCALTVNPAGTTVNVGASTTLTVSVRPDAPGPAGCTVRIVSNEPQQLYSFTVRGTAGASGEPELEVTRGAEVLADGAVVGGVAAQAGVAAIETIAVKNVGTAPLAVTLVEVSAQEGATCTLTTPAAFGVQPGGSADARISITRTGAADLECTLAIQSNDADENPTIVRFTSRPAGTHFEVYLNDVRVQPVAEADLGDRTKAINPGFQTSQVVRVVNTGADDMFEVFAAIGGPGTSCDESEQEPFTSWPVFPAGASESAVVNVYSEPRGPLEQSICVIDIMHSEDTRQHFYVTINRPARTPARGCSAGGDGAGWPSLALVAVAWCARRRRRPQR